MKTMKQMITLLLALAMLVCLEACGSKAVPSTGPNTDTVADSGSDMVQSGQSGTQEDAEPPEEDSDPEPNGGDVVAEPETEKTDPEPVEESEPEGESKPEEETESVDGIRPEFQDAMDAYEKFYTEYCDILKKYSQNPADFTLLMQYNELVTKAIEVDEAFEAWNEDEMSSEELKYYLEVNNRVMQMMVDVME